MAQMLHLELGAEATPLDRLRGTVHQAAVRIDALAQVLGGATPADATYVLTSGLLVSVSSPSVSDEDPFLADFGLVRAATVDFFVDSAREIETQYDQVPALVFALLEAVPGDAVLHYGYTEVWLVRRGGRYVLSDDDAAWPPERLARVDVPYERSHLTFVTM